MPSKGSKDPNWVAGVSAMNSDRVQLFSEKVLALRKSDRLIDWEEAEGPAMHGMIRRIIPRGLTSAHAWEVRARSSERTLEGNLWLTLLRPQIMASHQDRFQIPAR